MNDDDGGGVCGGMVMMVMMVMKEMDLGERGGIKESGLFGGVVLWKQWSLMI